jgi:hypothetical protein
VKIQKVVVIKDRRTAQGISYCATQTDTQAYITVQEIRWNATRVTEKKRYTIFYTCHNKEHKSGTGFASSRRVKHIVVHVDMKPLRTEGKKILNSDWLWAG